MGSPFGWEEAARSGPPARSLLPYLMLLHIASSVLGVQGRGWGLAARGLRLAPVDAIPRGCASRTVTRLSRSGLRQGQRAEGRSGAARSVGGSSTGVLRRAD